MRILIVDDSKSVHSFVKSLLGERYLFESAFDGQEGLNMASSTSYDLVLLDWEMPIMNGLDALKAIRSTGNNVPIIMVTSLNKPALINESINAGANEYIMKPFTKDILEAKINYVTPVNKVS